MKSKTLIALAAGTFVIVGTAGLVHLAQADQRDGWHGGYQDDNWRDNHRGSRHHRHHKGRHGGWRRHGHGFRRLIERFDTDKDGKLTQDELNKARIDLLARYDANKDGALSLDEFQKLWLDFKRLRMVRVFQRFDRDGDASITSDEFLKPFAHAVERMDRNDDGVLDKSDRRRRFGSPRGERNEDADGRPQPDNK